MNPFLCLSHLTSEDIFHEVSHQLDDLFRFYIQSEVPRIEYMQLGVRIVSAIRFPAGDGE